jgi:hypothetical protein
VTKSTSAAPNKVLDQGIVIDLLEHYEARPERLKDSRSVFTRPYARMTRALVRELATRTWHDAGWVAALAE